MNTSEKGTYKSGFAALVGRPNVGKSTLLNTILGEKVSITTAKPQTTRNRILGVKTLPNVGQLILLDTPGIHRPKQGGLNRYMVETALNSLDESDVVLFMVAVDDALNRGGEVTKGNRFIIRRIAESSFPCTLVINKIDTILKEHLLGLIDTYQKEYDFASIVPISARTGDGVDRLLDVIIGQLPEGPQYYPEDMLTDQIERFIVSEIIREKATILTRQEVPYSLAVEVETFKDEEKLLNIDAVLHVERRSQKGIVIGKGGSMLKKIGSKARVDIEKFFAKKVFLTLFVRVQKNWAGDQAALRRFGYK